MSDFPRYLTRDELFELLRQHGFPIGRSTLNKLCMPSKYEGPPIAAMWPGARNDRPLYTADEGLAWAVARLKPAPKVAP